MAVPPQLTQISFAAGIDESLEEEILDGTQAFLVKENTRQDYRGGATRRLGFAALSRTRLDATTRTAGNRCGSHNGCPFVVDGTYLDSYSEDLSVSVVRSRIPEAQITTRTTSSSSANDGTTLAFFADVALCNGCLVYASMISNVAYVSVEDATSGTVLRSTELLSSASGNNSTVVLGHYGNVVIAVVLDAASANMAGFYLDTTSAASITTGWVSLGNVATDHTNLGTGQTAISCQSLTNRVAFAYVNNSGGTSQITVKTLTTAGVIDSATVNTSSVTPNMLAIEGSIADTLWVAWNESTTVKIRGINAASLATPIATTFATALTLSNASTEAIGIVSSATAGKGRIIVNDGSSDRLQMRGFQTTAGACVADGSQVTVPNAMHGCRPFRVGTRYYVLAAPFPGSSANLQRSAVLCDFTDDLTWLRPLGSIAPGLAVFPGQTRAHVEAVSATLYVTVLSVVTSGVGQAVTNVFFDFASFDNWQSVGHNGSTFFSGGMLSYFDGTRVAEVGFVVRPPTPTTSVAGTGITGTYRYALVYEEVDAAGNWSLSSVSDAMITGQVAANQTITVVMRPLSITARQKQGNDPNRRMVLYRTTSTGTAPYYRLKAFNNDTSAVTTSYPDNNLDAAITSNAQLYAPSLPGVNGGALDRVAPPFATDLVSYNGMLVVATGRDIWWSGQTVSGEGTWFDNEFSTTTDGDGDITALAEQDGTLFVFKERSIYATSGEAPSDNGNSGGLGTLRRLAADVGCISPRSICVTGAGIFFQSRRGIELLNRGGSVDWIGEKVLKTVAAYPIVTSATLDAKNNLVRISLASALSVGRVGSDGRDVVYDLTLEQWESVDLRTGQTSSEAAQDTTMLTIAGEDHFAWLGVDGYVYVERDSGDASAYLDGSTAITKRAQTASFRVSGIQGKQSFNKLLIMMRRDTDEGIQVNLAYNYEQSFRTGQVWTATDINGLLASQMPITQLQYNPHDDAESCESIRVALTSSPSGTVDNGKGMRWLALTFDITPRTGAFDLPEAAT